MKKKLIYVMLSLSLITAGCSMFGSKKPKVESRDKLDKKMEEVQQKKDAISSNDKKKLTQIGIVAKGTQHALDKVEEPKKEVNVAKQLNDRVISLANNPEIKDVIRIQKIVDDLISEVKKEREKGASDLAKLDNELQYVQSERNALQSSLDKKAKQFEDLSFGIAAKNDENSAIVGDMNKWFGLGAIFYGIKRMIFSILIIGGILALLFFILKIASASNPIAATVFSLFEMAGSWVLKGVKMITPNSFGVAKFIPETVHLKYKSALDKIIDTLESLKEKNKVLDGDKKYKLEDLLVELDKKLDTQDKIAIDECLKELKWKI